jgi:hypothetical protein
MGRQRERRSRPSRLARALVAFKAEADARENELFELPRWRYQRRAELEETVRDFREQEKELVLELGGTPPANA